MGRYLATPCTAWASSVPQEQKAGASSGIEAVPGGGLRRGGEGGGAGGRGGGRRREGKPTRPVIGTLYPSPFDEPCRARERRKLGDAAGLTQFGVNLLVLPPGAWSSQRHWHTEQDEFVYVLEGEVTLV